MKTLRSGPGFRLSVTVTIWPMENGWESDRWCPIVLVFVCALLLLNCVSCSSQHSKVASSVFHISLNPDLDVKSVMQGAIEEGRFPTAAGKWGLVDRVIDDLLAESGVRTSQCISEYRGVGYLFSALTSRSGFDDM
jgi:hypothetical protein